MDQYVQKEIQDRISRISALNKSRSTVIIDPVAVERKVNDLLLLSKDIENLGACANMANQYFAGLTKQYHLSSSDLGKINTGMHVNDIASVLKQNEMVVFNHILLQSDTVSFPLHAAQ